MKVKQKPTHTHQLALHPSCVRLCCTLLEAPPSLKSIFIFAVLTFGSFYQRHNEASCSCTGALLHAGKTPRREEALVYRHIPSVQTICPHKENAHHLWSSADTSVAVGEASTLSVNVP